MLIMLLQRFIRHWLWLLVDALKTLLMLNCLLLVVLQVKLSVLRKRNRSGLLRRLVLGKITMRQVLKLFLLSMLWL